MRRSRKISVLETQKLIRAQGETQMQTQDADAMGLIFITIQGVGKRMVVDRQKSEIRSESRRCRVAARQARCQGRQNDQAGGFKVKTGKGHNRED